MKNEINALIMEAMKNLPARHQKRISQLANKQRECRQRPERSGRNPNPQKDGETASGVH